MDSEVDGIRNLIWDSAGSIIQMIASLTNITSHKHSSSEKQLDELLYCSWFALQRFEWPWLHL